MQKSGHKNLVFLFVERNNRPLDAKDFGRSNAQRAYHEE